VPLVHPCSAPDCGVLTMGLMCLEHEREARKVGTSAVLAAIAALPEQQPERRGLYLVPESETAC
jgi:hypothetical protein